MNIANLLNSPFISIALVGMLGTIIFSLKELPINGLKLVKRKIISRIIFSARIPDYDDLFSIIEKWLFDNHNSEYREVQAYLQGSFIEPGKMKRLPQVKFQSAPNIFTIKYSGKRILIEKSRKSIDHATDFRSLFAHEYIISGFKAKREITLLLEEAKEYYCKDLPRNSIIVRAARSSGYFDNENVITVKPIDKIILPDDLKKSLINDIDEFSNHKKWYIDRSIPYKRGYCFFGPPGTGKTSLSLAIASYLQVDVYVININSLENDAALQYAFSNIPAGSILLLEDIDSAFTGRTAHSKVSFSALLNCFDGAFYKEGLITCITTNHLDRLDAALLCSGRCDLKMEIPYPSEKEVGAFLSQFYGLKIDLKSINGKRPMAEVQEICIAHKTNPRAAIAILCKNSLSKIA